MAIIHAGFPEESLTENQSKDLIAAVEDAIDKIEDGYVPRFIKNWPTWEAHVFTCAGPEDGDWLKQNAPKWSPWEGARLGPVIESSQLKKVVAIRVSGEHHPEVIVKRLAKQNTTLKIKNWKIIGCARRLKVGLDDVETVVQVIMEKTEIGALKKLDLRPFCGASRAHCAIFRDKKGLEKSNRRVDQSPDEQMDSQVPASFKTVTVKIE
ncbi:hypothetical protein QAD02_012040 [Eretmocerus hayati]|uniref:Uncharacterized protein n=1 Tax=Eretmocerus hayati TaxID=131215 RepID=A0ACC2NYA5_9HYME|nr:hypothetical protein QAD02_012040 [Eretmocerus hayati]